MVYSPNKYRETEGIKVRRLGYDLSQTKLQAIAASLGIKTAVSNMTQAEKAQLRYYAIMTQVTTAQGDMARTLSSPANQLRILSASATMAARALGNIFIPFLNAILPVAIAAAQAIRAVAAAIASLFGYTLPAIDFSVTTDGLGGIGSGMDDIADGAGNAGGAAKKLKSILMGFDEINQLQDPTGGGGGGGGGGSGGGSMSGLDFELPDYDFLANMVSSQVDAIYAKLKPFIDWITDNLDSILAIIKAVAGAFLSWKIAKSLIPNLAEGSRLLSGIAGLAATLATLGIMVTLVYSFDTDFAETGNVAYLVADGISTIVGALLADSILQNVYGAKPGIGGGIALTISAATTIKAIYDGLAQGKFTDNANAIVLGIVAAAKSAIAGASIASALGLSVAGGFGVGLILGLAVTAVATIAGLGKKEINDNIQWGDTRLEADGIANIINRMFNYDVSATIDIVDTTINNEGEARAALNTAITRFNSTLLPFALNMKIDEGDANSLKTQADNLVAAFKTEMAARNEVVDLAVTLVPHRAADGTDASANILSAFATSEATLTAYMDTLGGQLADALNTGLVNGAFDQALITELSTKLAEVSKAVTIGTAQGEFNAEVGMMLSDLTEESFGEVVAQYSATVDSLNESLIDIETAAKAAMEGQLAGLQAMQNQLIADGDLTGAAELQTQIDTINAMLVNWNIGDNVALAMRNATAPMREQWATSLQTIFGENLSGLADFSAFTPFITGIAATWNDETLASEFEYAISSSIIAAIGEQNAQHLFDISDALELSETGFDLLGVDIQQQLYDTLAGAVGETRADEIFSQLGLTIGAAVTEVSAAAGEVGNVGTEIQTALAGGETEATDLNAAMQKAAGTATTEIPKATEATTEMKDAFIATGAEAANLNATIVEIPTEKSIEIKLTNYSASLMKIVAFRKQIDAINNVTVNLKVKAGLTAGAKAFLQKLKEFDPSVADKVNALLSLSQFANGGFPRSGELFIANENGRQEMVGRIGNRAAVANQDQIGDAIFKYMDAHTDANGGGINEDALATAIAGALKSAGIGAVYLDGKRLADSINRESRRSGRPAINY